MKRRQSPQQLREISTLQGPASFSLKINLFDPIMALNPQPYFCSANFCAILIACPRQAIQSDRSTEFIPQDWLRICRVISLPWFCFMAVAPFLFK